MMLVRDRACYKHSASLHSICGSILLTSYPLFRIKPIETYRLQLDSMFAPEECSIPALFGRHNFSEATKSLFVTWALPFHK